MKTSTVGIVSAAILMVVAGVGYGIAQAEGNQAALEQSGPSSPYVLVLPSGIDVDYGADGNPSPGVTLARGAVETGSLPAQCNSDSSMVEIEREMYYLAGGKLYGPY